MGTYIFLKQKTIGIRYVDTHPQFIKFQRINDNN